MYYQYIYLSYFIILCCSLHNSPPLLFSLLHSSLHPAPSFAFILLPSSYPASSPPFYYVPLSCFLPSILLPSSILLPPLHSAHFLYPASSHPFCYLSLSCYLPLSCSPPYCSVQWSPLYMPHQPPPLYIEACYDLLFEPGVLETRSPAVFNTYKNTFHFLSQSIDRFLCSFQQVFTAVSVFIGIKGRHFLIFMGIC